MLLVGGAALLVGVALLWRCRNDIVGRVPTLEALAAAVLALSFFVLPTQIHERYLFLSLAFVALCIASDSRLVLPFLVLVTNATLNILGELDGFVPLAHAAIADSVLPLLIAFLNSVLLIVLMAYLLVGSDILQRQNTAPGQESSELPSADREMKPR